MTQPTTRQLTRIALILLFPLAAVGCSESTAAPEDDGDPVAFNRLSAFPAVYSGITEATQTVIRSQEEWDAFWDRFRSEAHASSPPQVSFQERMVVAWAMGTRNTGGYLAEVVQVREMPDGGMMVRVVESSPAEGCATTQALTQPVDAVLVPRTDASVEFEAEAQVKQCEDDQDDGGDPGY